MKLQYLIIFLLVSFAANSQDISAELLKKHISYLASDKLKGRSTDSKGAVCAAKYIRKQFKKIGLLPKGTDGYLETYPYKYNPNPHAAPDPNAPSKTGTNVIGYIDNGAENTIIIGAHFDHLGLGHDGNSLDPNPEGKIHNGADDNASGVAGVIELARHYQQNGVKEPYNFLFICFSGEELGLFGSKRFCENPTIDLKKVHLMINLDMIGRLNDEKGLAVGGVGTAPELYNLVSMTKGNLRIKADSSGIGPSDHTSFYLKDIPVLFFFTGQHSDYHKPSDDTEKINFSGEQEVLQMVIRVTDGALTFPKFQFTPTKNEQQGNPGFKVTLGIMPDYVFDGMGLRVDGVTDNKPAFKAGLKAGDVIIQLGDVKVENIQNYMEGLAKFKKGDKTTVVVKRGEQEMKFEVTF